MKRLSPFFALFAGIFVIAGCASVVSIALYSKFKHDEKHAGHGWVHKQLGLTVEQDKALEPIEHRYHQQCDELEQQLRLCNKELAEAILANKKDSPQVKDAIEKIHSAMGQLQNVTIAHVFEMEKILTPAQYDKLLHLTADALINLDSEHAGE